MKVPKPYIISKENSLIWVRVDPEFYDNTVGKDGLANSERNMIDLKKEVAEAVADIKDQVTNPSHSVQNWDNIQYI